MTTTSKTFAWLMCEERYGEIARGSKTDGFMRSCLELVGVTARGRKLTSPELVALCLANGLDFVETDDGPGPIVDR